MSGFETLLNKAKEAKLITESDASTMLDEYNAAEQEKINQAVSAAEGTAFRQGYDEGYSNAKQQAEADTKKALDELLAKCDEEATTKLQSVIDILNADFDKRLQTLQADNDKEFKKSQEDFENELDKEHSDKLNEVYELLTKSKEDALAAMDEEHTEKLAEIAEAIKKNYVSKHKRLKFAMDKSELSTKRYKQ